MNFLPLFNTLLIMALVVGIALLAFALRGRRVGTEPRCPNCDFDLTPHFQHGAEATCPECARVVVLAAARIGTRRRRPKLAALALVLLLISGPLMVLNVQLRRSSPWLQQRKPASLLVWELRHGSNSARDAAAAELVRRDGIGINVDEQLTEVGRAILDDFSRANRSSGFSHDIDLLELAYGKDLLPRDRWGAFMLGQTGLRTVTPPAVRQHTALSGALLDGLTDSRTVGYSRAAPFVRSEIFVTLQDDQGRSLEALYLAEPSEYWGAASTSILSAFRSSQSITVPPGEYRVCGEVRVFYLAPWVNVAPQITQGTLVNELDLHAAGAPNKTIMIDEPLRVVDETTQLVTLDMDEVANDEMMQLVRQATVMNRPHKWGKGSLFTLSLPRQLTSNHAAVYRVHLQQGEFVTRLPDESRHGSWVQGWVFEPGQPVTGLTWMEQQPTSFQAGPITLTLTPDPVLAERLEGARFSPKILGRELSVEIQCVDPEQK